MEEVNRYLELPCLGLLPQVSKLQLAGRSLEDYPVRKPNSAYAEAVRSVETGILLSDRDVRPRVILLSSSRPNEGKTASAIALARLNALGGRRTILIDLDLRKPEVAQRLRLRKSHPGIADYLHGAARPESIIQRDEATGLDIIAAGRPQESTPELLRAGTLESLVTALRQEYDMILLDAPPVLAVSDTRLIARLADKTVFVVRWAETPRDVARLALRQLADGGADIAGVVISLVDIRRNQRFGFSDSESYGGVYRRYYQS
jgi:capsular exopolysaccharide synthesis family protein